ncbi:MAG: hypothetical protein ABIH00_00585 [Armatimonadota bacterium]
MGYWLDELPDKIDVGSGPYYAALSSDEKYLWVPCAFDDKLYVIRTSDNTVVKTFDTGDFPYHVLVK